MRRIAFIIILIAMVALFTFGKIKSWQEFFPDQVERIYIIMEDKTIFEQSNQDEVRVPMSIGFLKKRLESRNYSIKEIAVIIHNHRRKNYFTRADYGQYKMLKKYGFNGKFLLYCHRTKGVYDIEENKKGG